MADCCNDKACEIVALRDRQSSTLKIVLGINAIMFFVELTAGLLAGSVSLIADSLDMLGDALVYGFSIYVVARGARMKAKAAFLKGGIMAAFGLFVFGQAMYKIIIPHVPIFEMIGAIGLLALAANSLCLVLLWRHRADDINMSSVWLCSRNDIIANVSVLCAGLGVWLTSSGWPDILVGLGLAALFLRSALFVLRGAMKELQTTNVLHFQNTMPKKK
jgi:Co/Zn/Cd efflux system component